MCGITGWANLDPRTPPPDGGEELLRAMCDRMQHRGPDSEGYLLDDGIARDRFGEKPLYWGVFDRKLLFASEPKVLLAHPSVRPNLNLNALRQYLSYDYVPAPLSIYEGISKLPAAHTLTLEDGEVRVE